MAIKVIIKRKFKDGCSKDAHDMLIKARQNAMKEQGYIASESLCNCDDANEIVVLSMWRTREDWQRYKNGSARQELEGQMAEILEGQTETSAFEMGLK